MKRLLQVMNNVYSDTIVISLYYVVIYLYLIHIFFLSIIFLLLCIFVYHDMDITDPV